MKLELQPLWDAMEANPSEWIEWVFLDEHDGADWKYEPVLQVN